MMAASSSFRSSFIPAQVEDLAKWLAAASEEDLAEIELFPGVRYGDVEWKSNERAAGDKDVLSFNLKVTRTTRFDDPEYRQIYITTRRTLAALRIAPPEDARQLSQFGSFYLTATKVRFFAAWLIENGLRSFGEVKEEHIACFLDDYVNRPGLKKEKISGIAVRQMIRVIHLLWKVREHVPDGLRIDVLRGRSSFEVAQELTTFDQWFKERTPSIPESVFVPLLQAAVDWVQNKASSLIPLQKFFEREDVTIHYKRLKAKEFDWSPFLSFDGKPLTKRGGPAECLRRARRLLETACFVVIAGFTGMRSHELLAIKEGCIVELPEWSEYRIFRIRSRHHKSAKKPHGTDLTWVAPLIVKDAINLLAELTRAQRKRKNTDFLFPAARSAREEKIRGTVARNVREFMAHLDIGRWIDPASGNEETWTLSLHQFRRTFAKWVGAALGGSLYALKQHYKHVSIATTDGYVGNDQELYQTVAFYTQRASLQRLNFIIDNPESLAGTAGEEIRDRIRALRVEFQGAEGEDALRFKLHEHLTLAVKAGLAVVDCEYGFCLHRPDNKPLCGNKLSRRGPSLCKGCRNFVLTQNHLAWWKANTERNETMIARHREAGASNTQLAILQILVEESHDAINQIESMRQGVCK